MMTFQIFKFEDSRKNVKNKCSENKTFFVQIKN